MKPSLRLRHEQYCSMCRGGALGYTWYASMFGYDGYEECLNWVHIYEKTLPGLGGASVVDGGLSDSGAVLAHEIGHQLVRSSTRHTLPQH